MTLTPTYKSIYTLTSTISCVEAIVMRIHPLAWLSPSTGYTRAPRLAPPKKPEPEPDPEPPVEEAPTPVEKTQKGGKKSKKRPPPPPPEEEEEESSESSESEVEEPPAKPKRKKKLKRDYEFVDDDDNYKQQILQQQFQQFLAAQQQQQQQQQQKGRQSSSSSSSRTFNLKHTEGDNDADDGGGDGDSGDDLTHAANSNTLGQKLYNNTTLALARMKDNDWKTMKFVCKLIVDDRIPRTPAVAKRMETIKKIASGNKSSEECLEALLEGGPSFARTLGQYMTRIET